MTDAEQTSQWTEDDTPVASNGSLEVAVIPSAQCELVSVKRTTPLPEVQALMIRYDYSQLPVMSSAGNELRGAISWESIARASVAGSPSKANDCMRVARRVDLHSDLFSAIPAIIDDGYVFVFSNRGKLSGIVTTTDLALQFNLLARPFLQIGECERQLRQLLDKTFASTELVDASRYGKKNGDTGAAAMTLGEIKIFLSKPDNWKKLGVTLPREVVVDWVGEVGDLRNRIAHFKSDADDIHDELLQVRTLTEWVRTLL